MYENFIFISIKKFRMGVGRATDGRTYGVLGTVSQRTNVQFLSVGADSISARGVSGAYGMLPYGVWVSVSQRTNVRFALMWAGRRGSEAATR